MKKIHRRRAGEAAICLAILACFSVFAAKGAPVTLPPRLVATLVLPGVGTRSAAAPGELFAAKGILLSTVEVDEPELTDSEDYGRYLLRTPAQSPVLTPPAGALPVAALTVKGSASQLHCGAVYIKNPTTAKIDPEEALSSTLQWSFTDTGPEVLIVHTHGSESYNEHGGAYYLAGDTSRSTDCNQNVVRVGTELAEILTRAGIRTVHSTVMYDQPSYSSSYSAALKGIEGYLAQYPSIRVVIDLHRDALGGGGATKYKILSSAEPGGCAQLMLVMGTGISGLSFPNWRQNLAFAAKLQARVCASYPDLMRPITITKHRYNEHATLASVILEVGTDGNTLAEALAGVRLFGGVLADYLKELGA